MFCIVDTKAAKIKDNGGEPMMKFFRFLISLKVKFGSIAILTPLSFKFSFALPFLIAIYS